MRQRLRGGIGLDTDRVRPDVSPRRSLALLICVASSSFLAGCLTDGTVQNQPGSPPVVDPKAQVLAALGSIPVPTFSASSAVTEWENFLNDYPKRDWLLPHNTGASDYLQGELTKAGYKTELLTFKASFLNSNVPPMDVRVIRGVHEGANTSSRFALVAHYDTITTTLQGAYDDGAGTIAELQICKLLAQVQTQHTIECLFFDAEEKGLLASRAYVKHYQEDQSRTWKYDLVFGYDMTGINWPGYQPWNLYAMIGTQHDALTDLTDPFNGFLEVALHNFMNQSLPGADQGIKILDVHDRNSDEQTFKKVGIPVVRFAGGRNAADYPQYHQPLDTIPYVYQFVGGRANFEKGFEAVILSSYYTILGFDAFDPWNLPT